MVVDKPESVELVGSAVVGGKVGIGVVGLVVGGDVGDGLKTPATDAAHSARVSECSFMVDHKRAVDRSRESKRRWRVVLVCNSVLSSLVQSICEHQEMRAEGRRDETCKQSSDPQPETNARVELMQWQCHLTCYTADDCKL
jgi:hypothetical protein